MQFVRCNTLFLVSNSGRKKQCKLAKHKYSEVGGNALDTLFVHRICFAGTTLTSYASNLCFLLRAEKEQKEEFVVLAVGIRSSSHLYDEEVEAFSTQPKLHAASNRKTRRKFAIVWRKCKLGNAQQWARSRIQERRSKIESKINFDSWGMRCKHVVRQLRETQVISCF